MQGSRQNGSPWQGVSKTEHERLTEQFYAWEIRGRGWQIWDSPVELEPPFRPFVFHSARPGPTPDDDARKPTFLSSLAESVRDSIRGASSAATDRSFPDTVMDQEEPRPETGYSTEALVELGVSLPSKQTIDKERAEQFLLGLSLTADPISFEVLGWQDSIRLHLACRTPDHSRLWQQLKAYFPEAVISDQSGYLKRFWDEAGIKETVVVDFGLSQEFMRPLRLFKNFEIDPFIGTITALEDVKEHELGLLQVLFQPVRYPWAESIIRSVTDWEGKPFFVNAPEMDSLAKQKTSKPLYAVVIRAAAQSPVVGRGWRIAQGLGGALTQFTNPMSNELIPLTNDGYDEHAHRQNVLLRQTHRTGMLLSSEELVSLVHLPSSSVRSLKLKREDKRTKCVPPIALGHALMLGENHHQGKTSKVTLSPDQRIRHTYVIGASGTGKSTLLCNMIIQDIQNGEGVGVLDPHGDLIDQILGGIPEQRFEDVVLFDPSDEEYPIGFNILSAHSELEKNLLASDLVAAFQRLSTNWGPQMNSVLANAILAMLESPTGGTLSDLRRFLVDRDYRKRYLDTVRDPEVVFYWRREFPLLIGRPEAPILTRLDTFLRPRIIRNIICQKENRLDFRDILDSGKILLAKLSHGRVGEENAHLLGSCIVSKIQQTVMSRQDIPEERRRNYYLYLDEFQDFITPSMETILSGARKYHLGLILAHQELRQIWSKDKEVASSAISNPYTRICFRLGDFDAQKLKDGFSSFDAKDLQNLGMGEAICRIERAEYDFNLTTSKPKDIPHGIAEQRKAAILALSRTKYSTRREEVEKEGDRVESSSSLMEVAASPYTQRLKKQKAQGFGEQEPLSMDEKRFLEFVSAHPDLFVTKIYETLGLSGYKGDKIKAGLIEKEYLCQQETRQGEGGRLAKVITLTEKGWRAIKDTASSGSGKGGDLHRQVQLMIKEQAETYGWKAKIEEKIQGSLETVDVGLTKDDLKVAIEISVTTRGEQEIPNIQKCLEAGYDYILCVCPEERNLAAIKIGARKHFTARERERLRFFIPSQVKEFLQSLSSAGIVSEKPVGSDIFPPQKQLLGIHEAAQFLGVRSNTVYTWVSQRKIPFVKVGRLTKFHRKDLEQWLEQKKVTEHELRPKNDV
jgi:excisionase family DNA binding protein